MFADQENIDLMGISVDCVEVQFTPIQSWNQAHNIQGAPEAQAGHQQFMVRAKAIQNNVASGALWNTQVNTQGDATLQCNFLGKDSSYQTKILATDYDSYLLTYKCIDGEELGEDGEDMFLQSVSVSVRNPDCTQEELANIKKIAQEAYTAAFAGVENNDYSFEENLTQIKQGATNQCQYYQGGETNQAGAQDQEGAGAQDQEGAGAQGNQ